MREEEIYINLIKILKNLELKENFISGVPQNEEEIRNLEKELHLKFPKGYKIFLQKYGYMSWLGGEIYGPSDDDYCDLITRNKEARNIEFPKEYKSLPRDAFIFQGYAGGGYFMLFSEDSRRAGEVGLFLHETYNNEEQTWNSFEAFLDDYYCSLERYVQ